MSEQNAPDHVDDDLIEAVASIPDADIESITQYDDRAGHFVINSEPDDQDVDEIAYSRWEISRLPDWIEPVLTSIGIRAVRTGQEDV